MDYLALAFGSVLLAADFPANKIYQRMYGTKLKASFRFNALVGLFTALLFFLLNGCRLEFSLFSFLMAGVFCTLSLTNSTLGFRLMKSGTMAVYTLALMAGGMVLPYVFGLLFLNEPFRYLRTAGLLVILTGVALPNLGKEKPEKWQILMYVTVFILNGFVSITSKVHQINTRSAVGTMDFIIWQGIIKFALSSLLFIREKRDREESRQSPRKAVLITAVSAALSGTFSLIQFSVATTLPASVLYPFNTGLTVILSSIMGVLLFREKLSKKQVAGILLCFAGTMMFL